MVDKNAYAIRESTPAYRQGDDLSIRTIILLSAPGSKEEEANRPAAGETGKTLQTSLEILHEKDAGNFPSSRLNDYTIANAVEEIHYMNKTGRTEGTDEEVREPENIERIKSIIKYSKVVVALGDKSYLAIKSANYEGIVYKAKHPSLQSLNRYYKSDKGSPNRRKKDRISQWVDDLMRSKKYVFPKRNNHEI